MPLQLIGVSLTGSFPQGVPAIADPYPTCVCPKCLFHTYTTSRKAWSRA